MIEKLFPKTHLSEETFRRSIVKTISYRMIIEFSTLPLSIYLLDN